MKQIFSLTSWQWKNDVMYEDEQNEKKALAEQLRAELDKDKEQNDGIEKFIAKVKAITDIQELTPDKSSGHRKQKIEIYYNAVGIIDLPTIKEDDCIALHGRCKGKKIAV
jgi:hypothetical protein